VGQEKLHRTEKGKMVPLIDSEGEFATEQFAISDQRSAGVMVAKLKELGFDPVWKDWDGALGGV
jgi:2-iminoacetate synthase